MLSLNFAHILRMGFAASAALALSVASAAADSYTETFMHLKPGSDDLSAFVLDLHQEDESYTPAFVETLPVTGIRLVIRTDRPSVLSRQWLEDLAKDEYASVYVSLAVETQPSNHQHHGVVSASLGCQVVSSARTYSVETPGLLCRTEYDAGDDGEFLIEPEFGGDGTAAAFNVHFSVKSQKTSDHEGTPDGPAFIGALLNGRQISLEQSVSDFREFYRNARPLLRLKQPDSPLIVRFGTYPRPDRE